MVKNLAVKRGHMDLIPGLRRIPGGGNGNPLQNSCREIPWTEELGGLQLVVSQRGRHGLLPEQQP